MIKWTKQNTLKPTVPAKPGIYKFYDRNRELLYIGHAKNLRHRVQSYRQDDDFREHPTKAALRPKIAYYIYDTMPIKQARRVEKRIKQRAPHNHK